MRKKKKKSLDVLQARILLFLLGITFGLIGILLVALNYTELQGVFLITSMVVFIVTSTVLLYGSVFFDKKKVLVWANNTGDNNVIIIFYIFLAYGIASFYESTKRNS